ncbi:MAG: 1-acyl-sn-glycerol-3-phosphate acyltransferase [Flavobacteriales bacterium]|nr:1-acyl-sn-glycerol-3-phosphate acyltransferase [Flavobacteriales bacterium]
MLYYFVKIIMLLYQRVYFKRIYISGVKHIPKNQPVFLAANHTNGFLDGVMVSELLWKPTYIFVRGDVFKKKWANFLLRSLKLIPIFRSRDGEDARENLSNNNSSFDQLYQEFKKNKVVLIFPEADAIIEKRLRPLKKGMARIVADMESREDGNMKVAIVPTSINYLHYKKYRNEIMIQFSEPIYLSDYKTEDGNDRKAQNRLTSDLENRIKKMMVDINPGDDEITETALNIYRNSLPHNIWQFWHRKNTRIYTEIGIADGIKNEKPDSILRQQLKEYATLLKENDLTELGFNPLKIWQWIFLLIFSIPSFLSWMVYKWGLVYGKKVVNTKIKKDELYESVYCGIGLSWFLILTLIGYPIAAIFLGWSGVMFWFIFSLFSISYQHCRDFWLQFVEHRKWNKSAAKVSNLRVDLIKKLEVFRAL